jgi:3-hydroxybutyryl-CoA dehydrogenase
LVSVRESLSPWTGLKEVREMARDSTSSPSKRGTVAVLGAGTMGHGIAQVMAQAQHRVTLYDPDRTALTRALEAIEGNLAKGVELGKVAPEERDETLARIHTFPNLDQGVEGATVVVEAIPERADLKKALFRQVEPLIASDTLLASNTSSLSIQELALILDEPGRFLGLHFFNPVHIMKLVEIVHGPETDREAVDRALALVEGMGKKPIVVKDSPGFASSRLGVALGLEAIRMVEEGVASARDIDRAMELGYRHPMGPLRLTDLIGLDVRLEIAEYLHRSLGQDHFDPPELLRRMVDEGKLGQKAGQGFYSWED